MKKSNKYISCLLGLLMMFSAASITACNKSGELDSSTSVSGENTSNEQENVTIQLDKTSHTVSVDEEFYLVATSNSSSYISWSTSDNSVASVSSSGRVLAKKEGTAVITAAIGNTKATCSVTVTKAIVVEGAALRVEKNTYFFSLEEMSSQKINAEYITGENGTPDTTKTISYTSMNTDVATVSADGTVTPVALGTTEIILSCEGLTAYVVADVYTAGISTPSQWMDAIKDCCSKEILTTEKRYYLENDIDFDGVEYDIGAVANGVNSAESNPYHFGSEINGNYHSVKNITLWKEDSTLNPNAHQSIFGRTIGATIKNIAFENIVFNSARSYGLCAVMMHHGASGKIKDNVFTNVYADFLYAYDASARKGHMAVGITGAGYGAVMSDIFVRMRSVDGSNLKDIYEHVYGFSLAEWVWYGGNLTNVITMIEDVPLGEAEFLNAAAGDQKYKHGKTNCYAVNTKIQASYYAHQIFDDTV